MSLFFSDLESYVQGHKKKHGLKSPCQGWVTHAFSNIFESIEHSHKISKNTKCLQYKIVLYIQNLSDNKQWNVFFFLMIMIFIFFLAAFRVARACQGTVVGEATR